jgi:hypothetical protein
MQTKRHLAGIHANTTNIVLTTLTLQRKKELSHLEVIGHAFFVGRFTELLNSLVKELEMYFLCVGVET